MNASDDKPRRGRVRGNAADDITLTVDTFIAEVPIDPRRCILVYLRQHGGRRYVRWRVFHKHQKWGNWYPDKRRAFVLPVGNADELAKAIASAACGEQSTSMPAWLEEIDARRERNYRKMLDLNAPPIVLDGELRQRVRGWAMGR